MKIILSKKWVQKSCKCCVFTRHIEHFCSHVIPPATPYKQELCFTYKYLSIIYWNRLVGNKSLSTTMLNQNIEAFVCFFYYYFFVSFWPFTTISGLLKMLRIVCTTMSFSQRYFQFSCQRYQIYCSYKIHFFAWFLLSILNTLDAVIVKTVKFYRKNHFCWPLLSWPGPYSYWPAICHSCLGIVPFLFIKWIKDLLFQVFPSFYTPHKQ